MSRKIASKTYLKTAFSTPELLMALVVFSFGLLPLIVLFQKSYKTTAQAKNLMIAQSIGRTIIDEIRAMGFDALMQEIKEPTGLFHDFKPVSGKLVPSDPDSVEYPEYYQKFQTKVLADLDNDQNPKKIRIEVEVKWREPDREFTLAFGTVVVKYGAKFQ